MLNETALLKIVKIVKGC